MEFFDYHFPMNGLAVGSVIPGQRFPVRVLRIANFMDYTSSEILKRRRRVEAVTRFPRMHQEHAAGHGFMSKLEKAMNGKQAAALIEQMKRWAAAGKKTKKDGPQDPAAPPTHAQLLDKQMPEGGLGKPEMAGGYEQISENRDWRFQ